MNALNLSPEASDPVLPTPVPAAPVRWSARCLEALERGEPQALQRVDRLVRNYLVHRTWSWLEPAWDDIRQDVLFALVCAVQEGRVRSPAAFPAYVRTTTRNRVADWMRSNARYSPSDLLAESGAPMRRCGELALRMDLQRALDTLPVRERRVIEALYLQGRSYRAAAEALDLPLGTLKRLQTRGLRSIRAHMRIEDAPGGPEGPRRVSPNGCPPDRRSVRHGQPPTV